MSCKMVGWESPPRTPREALEKSLDLGCATGLLQFDCKSCLEKCSEIMVIRGGLPMYLLLLPQAFEPPKQRIAMELLGCVRCLETSRELRPLTEHPMKKRKKRSWRLSVFSRGESVHLVLCCMCVVCARGAIGGERQPREALP